MYICKTTGEPKCHRLCYRTFMYEVHRKRYTGRDPNKVVMYFYSNILLSVILDELVFTLTFYICWISELV